MELWIRSQDRDMLMKVFEVRLNWQNDKEIICNSYTTDCCDYDYRCLGTYATKERALEILDEIASMTKNRYIVKPTAVIVSTEDIAKEHKRLNYLYSGEFILENPPFEIEPINSNVIYYEMPKE